MPKSDITLINDMRQYLLESEFIVDYTKLTTIFVDKRIHMWSHELPKVDNPLGQVNALIAYLIPKQNEHNVNGLFLLLEVIVGLLPSSDRRHLQGRQLKKRLEAETLDYLKHHIQSSSSSQSPITQNVYGNNNTVLGQGQITINNKG